MEVWKDIPEYEGLYQVSNFGKIRSLNWKNRGFCKEMYLKKHKNGYLQVELSKNHSKKMFLVHRIVAMAFIPNTENKPLINHKDYNKKNNYVGNLEWCTMSENVLHGNLRGTSRRKTRLEKINQFSIDGMLIKSWDSCLDIRKAKNYNQTPIFECCDKKRKTAYGFIWQYAN
jgi:hypothetical protein